MKTILILLLMAAPASAKWDLNNLTPSQRTSLIIMRDRWNNGYRGRPSPTPRCSWGRMTWYDGKVKDAKPQSGHTPARSGHTPATYGGGPLTILNPFVSKAEGGSGA